jgi:hypothetical protein
MSASPFPCRISRVHEDDGKHIGIVGEASARASNREFGDESDRSLRSSCRVALPLRWRLVWGVESLRC